MTFGSEGLDGTRPEEELAHDVGRAMRWSLVNQAGSRGATLLLGIVLARILVPEEFGEFAVALTTVTVLLTVNDLGGINGLVVWKGDVREAAPTALAMALVWSIALYGVTFAAAPWIADALNASDAAGLIRLLTLRIVIDAGVIVQLAVLRRELLQERQTAAEVTGLAVTVGLSIALAAAGAGAWSLAWGQLVGAGVTALLMTLLIPIRVLPRYDSRIARELLRFGLPVAGSHLAEQGLLNVDYVVVGAILGPTALGFYLLAFNLSSWPVNVLRQAIHRVAVAGFTRLTAQRARFAGAFTRAFALTITLTVPIVVGLVVLAQPLVTIVYGLRWEPSVVPLRFLAVLGGIRVLVGLALDFVVADGRTRASLALTIVWLIPLVPALIVGAHLEGIEGVSAAHAAIGLVVTLPTALIVVHRSGARLRSLTSVASRPLLGGAIGALAALGVLLVLDAAVQQLVVGAMAIVAAYAVLVVPRNEQLAWGVSRLRPARPGGNRR